MKVKELISFLENFNEDTEVEVEIFDVASDKCLDSTYDIGISDESSHPALMISTDFSMLFCSGQ